MIELFIIKTKHALNNNDLLIKKALASINVKVNIIIEVASKVIVRTCRLAEFLRDYFTLFTSSLDPLLDHLFPNRV